MNQINFEREFDERLDAMLDTKLAGIFGDAYPALKALPTEDQEDSVTVYLDSVNDVLKVSGSGT